MVRGHESVERGLIAMERLPRGRCFGCLGGRFEPPRRPDWPQQARQGLAQAIGRGAGRAQGRDGGRRHQVGPRDQLPLHIIKEYLGRAGLGRAGLGGGHRGAPYLPPVVPQQAESQLTHRALGRGAKEGLGR